MTELIKRRQRNGNGGSLPSLRNDLFRPRFFMPRLFDLDDDFFTRDISMPPTNIEETEKEFKLELSVPGMKRDDFNVEIQDGMLTISSEKEEEKKEDEKDYKRREFSYSSFSRSFSLPDNADENKVNAKYDNGMLKITIPKKEADASRSKKQITVG